MESEDLFLSQVLSACCFPLAYSGMFMRRRRDWKRPPCARCLRPLKRPVGDNLSEKRVRQPKTGTPTERLGVALSKEQGILSGNPEILPPRLLSVAFRLSVLLYRPERLLSNKWQNSSGTGREE
jgi:hypothetical protein